MMLLFLGLGYRQTYMYNRVSRFSSLNNFGFDAGGSFEIRIKSDNMSNIHMFLLNREDVDKLFLTATDMNWICAKNVENITQMHYHIIDPTKEATWSGTVPYKSLYTLYILKCNSNVFNFQMETIYRNKNSNLDSRMQYYPFIYHFISMVYGVFVVIWTLNGWKYSMFRVPLHTVLLSLSALHCISAFMESRYYKRIDVDDMSNQRNIKNYIIDLLFYVEFLSTLALISTGWCIFREKIPMKMTVSIICYSVLLTVGFLLFPYSETPYHAIILVGCVLIGLLFYCRSLIINSVVLSRLADQMVKHPLITSKIMLAKRFVVQSSVWLIISFLIGFIMTFYDVSSMYSLFCFETYFIIQTLIQMKFFLFREKYKGEEAEVVPNHAVTTISRPIVLIEPKNTEVSIAFSEIC